MLLEIGTTNKPQNEKHPLGSFVSVPGAVVVSAVINSEYSYSAPRKVAF